MDQQPETSQPARARRPSGRDAKSAARTARSHAFVPYITRKIPYYEVLNERRPGAPRAQRRHDPRGDRHRFPRRRRGARASGRTPAPTCRASGCAFRAACAASWCRSSAPAGVHAARAQPRAQRRHRRQPHGVCPAYGSPFVRNLDEGRRYARIEDFRNFVKLAYLANSLHHSAARSASPSTCRSTSGTSTWCTAT